MQTAKLTQCGPHYTDFYHSNKRTPLEYSTKYSTTFQSLPSILLFPLKKLKILLLVDVLYFLSAGTY